MIGDSFEKHLNCVGLCRSRTATQKNVYNGRAIALNFSDSAVLTPYNKQHIQCSFQISCRSVFGHVRALTGSVGSANYCCKKVSMRIVLTANVDARVNGSNSEVFTFRSFYIPKPMECTRFQNAACRYAETKIKDSLLLFPPF